MCMQLKSLTSNQEATIGSRGKQGVRVLGDSRAQNKT